MGGDLSFCFLFRMCIDIAWPGLLPSGLDWFGSDILTLRYDTSGNAAIATISIGFGTMNCTTLPGTWPRVFGVFSAAWHCIAAQVTREAALTRFKEKLG